MSTEQQPRPLPSALPDVPIDLGDGKKRFLRYSIGSMRRLKRSLGRPIFGRGGSLQDLDEDLLPQLIYEGLRHQLPNGTRCDCGAHAENGIDPDIPLEVLDQQGANVYAYWLDVFSLAFFGQLPEKKTPEPMGSMMVN